MGFNPDLAAEDNVVINAVMMGLTRAEARRRFGTMIAFAELEEFVDLKLKNYSSGMTVRLGFAVATQVDADVLLVDEVLAVGDASFQQKCFEVFQRLKDAGKTIVLVTHDMGLVERFCDRAMLIERGRVVDVRHARGGAAGVPPQARGSRAACTSTGPTAAPAGDVQILGLRAVAGDLTIRSRFIEGEPVVLETTVLAATGAESVQFTLSLPRRRGPAGCGANAPRRGAARRRRHRGRAGPRGGGGAIRGCPPAATRRGAFVPRSAGRRRRGWREVRTARSRRRSRRAPRSRARRARPR